ncbi:uncharacterized protein LOC118195324 [Stegodyphus dumicola]|uniref:uncharacterized protein LOC118195324 n=1 Tax=Stegodyphus dumicola TaxID=202533 RepID=UPI0015B0FEEC|nr:uncharacterized protein LOC118195324 [Stegodyphus dumicola]
MHDDKKIHPDSGDQNKPKMIMFYNMTKGGVDTVDELCGTCSVSRCLRWLLTIFFGLMNIAGINAFIIHYFNHEQSNMKRKDFLKELSLALVKEHAVIRSKITSLPIALKTGVKRLAGVDVTNEPKKFQKRSCRRCDICP